MNKTDLILAVSEQTGLAKKDADKAVNAVISTIMEALSGTFEVRTRSERQGRDPRTNSPITIPASKVPAFKAGKAFKDATAI